MNQCRRCGSNKNLEKDHIKLKSRGGTDEKSNMRFLCGACHDYRHARDKIIKKTNKWLSTVGTKRFNPIRFTRWVMRLGVLEAFNTPAKIHKTGKYTPYWDITTTRQSSWHPQIKLLKQNRLNKKDLDKKIEKYLRL